MELEFHASPEGQGSAFEPVLARGAGDATMSVGELHAVSPLPENFHNRALRSDLVGMAHASKPKRDDFKGEDRN